MIPPVMNRPMFNQAQPQLQAPQMSMNPQAQAQIQMAEKQASAQALAGMAQGIEDLNQQLENAENYTGVMDALRGNTASVKERRGELAQLVGDKDANKTPESVLTLVQPTMMFLEVAEGAQQNAPGGISNLPVQPSGAQQTMPSGGGGITNFFAGVRSPGTQEAVARMEQGEQPVKRSEGSPQQGEMFFPYQSLGANIGPNRAGPLTYTPEVLSAQSIQQTIPQLRGLYGPLPEPTTFEEQLGKSMGALDQYIQKPRTTDQILSEYQTILGDPTKDLAKSSFYGGLTKFGAQLAQKPGGVFAGGAEALTDVAPGISEDFTKVTQAKIKQDQAMKLAALKQSQAEEQQQRQAQFGIAREALSATNQFNTQLNNLKIQQQNQMLGLAKDINKMETQAKNTMNKFQAEKNLTFLGKPGIEFVEKGSSGQNRIVAYPSAQSKTGLVVLNPDDGQFYEFNDTGFSKFNPAAVEMDKLNRVDVDKIKIKSVFMPERFAITGDLMTSFQNLETYDKALEGNKVVKRVRYPNTDFFDDKKDGHHIESGTPEQTFEKIDQDVNSITYRVNTTSAAGIDLGLNGSIIKVPFKKLQYDENGKLIKAVGLDADEIVFADTPENQALGRVGKSVYPSYRPQEGSAFVDTIQYFPPSLNKKGAEAIRLKLNGNTGATFELQEAISTESFADTVGIPNNAKQLYNKLLIPLIPGKQEGFMKTFRNAKTLEYMKRITSLALVANIKYPVAEQNAMEELVDNPSKAFGTYETTLLSLRAISRYLINEKERLLADLYGSKKLNQLKSIPLGSQSDPFMDNNETRQLLQELSVNPNYDLDNTFIRTKATNLARNTEAGLAELDRKLRNGTISQEEYEIDKQDGENLLQYYRNQGNNLLTIPLRSFGN